MTKITNDAQPCMECSMLCYPDEYHPYAACLMFKGCCSGVTVRANLQSVIDYATRLAPPAGFVMADPIVRFNDDGSLDEVVGSGSFRLEQMDTGHWWMQLGPHMVNLHARGKITAHFGKNEAHAPGAADGK